MSPSALQRVCLPRWEAQVLQSFLRMGVPREACHVPEVRCSNSAWFVLSHTDVVTEGKARRCDTRALLDSLQQLSGLSKNEVPPSSKQQGLPETYFMPDIHWLTAEGPILCFVWATSCHSPPPRSTKVWVLMEQVEGKDMICKWEAEVLNQRPGRPGQGSVRLQFSGIPWEKYQRRQPTHVKNFSRLA